MQFCKVTTTPGGSGPTVKSEVVDIEDSDSNPEVITVNGAGDTEETPIKPKSKEKTSIGAGASVAEGKKNDDILTKVT